MSSKLDRPEHEQIFKRMLLMRRFEEKVIHLFQQKAFFAHFHVYIGQEAVGATALQLLRPDDFVSTTHRNHGHVVGRGADAGRALAEIIVRADGLNGGRAGTLHMCDPTNGFIATSAMVGASVPLATGAALAAKQSGSDKVCIAFFGDSALEEGMVLEALNMAELWSVPAIFICENNTPGALGAPGEYAISVNAAAQLADIPAAMGIDSRVVDGTTVTEVYDVVSEAVTKCRQGEGPVFIEAMIERWPGSIPLWPEPATGKTDLSMAWNDSLIPEEHANWIRVYDPILRYSRLLLSASVFTNEELLEIDQQVSSTVDEAEAFALASAFPDPESATERIFA